MPTAEIDPYVWRCCTCWQGRSTVFADLALSQAHRHILTVGHDVAIHLPHEPVIFHLVGVAGLRCTAVHTDLDNEGRKAE